MVNSDIILLMYDLTKYKWKKWIFYASQVIFHRLITLCLVIIPWRVKSRLLIQTFGLATPLPQICSHYKPSSIHIKMFFFCVHVCIYIAVFCIIYCNLPYLAPKLTSRACALRVCSPPAAIAVTQAISQTLICKALRIDSPSHAQTNKQRHKTWSFCLKYYILSKSNKIQRQVGGIFHLWQFLLDQIAHGRWPGIKKWRHVNKWKPWSFQLHCAVKPYFSVTKMKDAPLKYMIRI